MGTSVKSGHRQKLEGTQARSICRNALWIFLVLFDHIAEIYKQIYKYLEASRPASGWLGSFLGEGGKL